MKSLLDTTYGRWVVIEEFERYNNPFLKVQCRCGICHVLSRKMFESQEMKDRCYYCRLSNPY